MKIAHFLSLAPRLLASLLAFVSVSAMAQIYGRVDSAGAVMLSNEPAPGFDVVVRPAVVKTIASLHSAKSVRTSAKATSFDALVRDASLETKLDPSLIKAVIAVESNYNPSAVSSKGAVGLMQVMPATGRRYTNDDLADPKSNVLAGSRYLRDLLGLFGGDVSLALAAYNAGENAVLRAGNRIPGYPETQQYVPKVLSYYQHFAGLREAACGASLGKEILC